MRSAWATSSAPTRSLRLAVLFLGATLIGGQAVLLIVLLDVQPGPAGLAWGSSAVSSLYVAAGCLAWWRRPSNAMGALIVWGGVSLLFSLAGAFAALASFGAITATLILAVMVHLLHAFPSGRVREPAARITVLAGYFVCLALQIPLYAFDPAAEGLAVFVAPRPDLLAWGRAVQGVAGAMVMIATGVILTLRLRRSKAWQRKVLIPLFIYGIVAVLFIPVAGSLFSGWFQWSEEQVVLAQLIDIAGVPVAFLLAVLRGGFARTGEVQELAAWLSAPTESRTDVSTALAGVLGDPLLRVVFWVPERGQYIDAQGLILELPDATATRSAVEIRLSGELIGAVIYDSELIADPELVMAAGRLVALGVERERLAAALLATHQSLRRSRERLVETADRERRRIAQDLHDGLQVKLVLLAIEAQQMANQPGAGPAFRAEATNLRRGIDTAAAELRLLVHAVMPSALLERGLGLAADDLVDRLPVPAELSVGDIDRLPRSVASSAYFVVAEALTNVVKHAGASKVSVRLDTIDGTLAIEVTDDGRGGADRDRGTGLRGLADRVDVLGGSLALLSPAGGGTRLSVRLPVSPDLARRENTEPPPARPSEPNPDRPGSGSPDTGFSVAVPVQTNRMVE